MDNRIEEYFNNDDGSEDEMEVIGRFEVDLKEGEGMYFVEAEFADITVQIAVRDREMKTITTVLNYNKIPYRVEPIE